MVKKQISNLVHTTRFWNNLHQVRSKSRLEIQISFESNKTKGPKQDSKNRLRSAMPEGGEP